MRLADTLIRAAEAVVRETLLVPPPNRPAFAPIPSTPFMVVPMAAVSEHPEFLLHGVVVDAETGERFGVGLFPQPPR